MAPLEASREQASGGCMQVGRALGSLTAEALSLVSLALSLSAKPQKVSPFHRKVWSFTVDGPIYGRTAETPDAGAVRLRRTAPSSEFMIKAPQVLIFMVCAAGMVALLSVVRAGFRNQSDAEFWNNLSGAGELVAEMRAEEAKTLASGELPIEAAIDRYSVRGRAASPAIQVKVEGPQPPVAGWIQHPDFKERSALAKKFTESAEATKAPAAEPAETPAAPQAAQ